MMKNTALGHIPSYADLNTIEQFNFPDEYLDSNRVKISNNMKVNRSFLQSYSSHVTIDR